MFLDVSLGVRQNLRWSGERAVQHERKPDSRPTKLKCDILLGLLRVRGRKRICALIARSRQQSVCVASSERKDFHDPIRWCAA